MSKLPYSFYLNDDVVELAVQLLGKQLITNVDGVLTGGIIVETEAYNGVWDKACHAYNGRFTPRTSTMYEPGGVSYVYLCYGIHHLFNVITGAKDSPQAVLIRAVEPTLGLSAMLERRKMDKLSPRLTAGPGSLAKALSIDRNLNGADLQGDEIWIEDNGIRYKSDEIVATTRIGIDYADDHALLPWRFYVKESPYVSRKP